MEAPLPAERLMVVVHRGAAQTGRGMSRHPSRSAAAP
jgi:hypothetical protein